MTYANAPRMGPRQHVGTRSNGMAIAGLVCGIVGLVLAAIVLGPLAIIFGGIGLSRANHGAEHRTMSIWAIALGIADIVLWIAVLAVASRHGGLYYG
jgi:uncharacterized membrane-anchored protein